MEQIKELHNEGDPELFLQYAKTVSKNHPKLYVFDLYQTKPPEAPEEHMGESDTSSFPSTKKETKIAQKFLKRIKQKFKQVMIYF